MKIFTPDFFSVSKPSWNQCTPRRAIFIDNLVKLELPLFWNSNNSYFQTGSHEINSSNYKLEIGGSDEVLVLKKWPENSNLKNILYHNEILDFFNQEGIPSPQKMFFRNSRDYCEFEGNIWTLQKFKKGNFFDGDLNLFNKLIERVLELQEKLKKFHSEEVFDAVAIDFEYDVIREFLEGTRQFEQCLPSEDLGLLKDNLDCISCALHEVEELSLDLNQRNICHLDLHPHNILINKQDVSSFLDFDSVKNVNYFVAVAYFSLKVCKQACVTNQELKPAVIGKMFLDQLFSRSEECEKQAEKFHVFANAEVLRRLNIILKLNVNDSNGEWNKALPVLLAHLTESEILFNPFPR